jgi:hypothetical protein
MTIGRTLNKEARRDMLGIGTFHQAGELSAFVRRVQLTKDSYVLGKGLQLVWLVHGLQSS